MSDQPEKKTGRIAQIRQAYGAIKSLDRNLGWWMLLAAVVTAGIVIGIGFLFGGWWRWYAVAVAIPPWKLECAITETSPRAISSATRKYISCGQFIPPSSRGSVRP